MKKISKKILEGMLVGSLVVGNVNSSFAPKKSFELDLRPKYRKITENFQPDAYKVHPYILSYSGETDTLYIPEYSKSEVPPTHCSRYIRKMSKDVFGLNYPQGDAWDIRKESRIVETSKRGFSLEDINKMIQTNQIQPGMVFGIYNPHSNYNKKGRLYTHLGGYLSNSGDIPLIAHQFGRKTRIDSLEWFYNKGMRIIEILDASKD